MCRARTERCAGARSPSGGRCSSLSAALLVALRCSPRAGKSNVTSAQHMHHLTFFFRRGGRHFCYLGTRFLKFLMITLSAFNIHTHLGPRPRHTYLANAVRLGTAARHCLGRIILTPKTAADRCARRSRSAKNENPATKKATKRRETAEKRGNNAAVSCGGAARDGRMDGASVGAETRSNISGTDSDDRRRQRHENSHNINNLCVAGERWPQKI